MAFPRPVRLTYINAEETLIKVYGVADGGRYKLVEDILSAFSEKLHQGLGIPRSLNDLMPGKIVLVYLATAGQYRRAQIICADNSTFARQIYVKLIDIGRSILVDVNDIRCMDEINHLIQSVPDTPLAVEYILFGCIRSRPWTNEDLEFANRITCIQTESVPVALICKQPVINILLPEKNGLPVPLAKCLADRGCVALVQAEQQKTIIQSKYDVKLPSSTQFLIPPPGFSATAPNMQTPSFPYSQSQPVSAPLYQPFNVPVNVPHYPRLRLNRPVVSQPAVQQQYILDTLPVGSTHEVYVPHVIDGMQNFIVQLKKNVDEKLTKLMAKINDTPPEPFTDPLQPGTVCLGRFSGDDSLCRAVVCTVLAEGANLYFVDFGNSEIVSFNEIYKMSPAFMEEKVMAIRFTLANLNNYSLSTHEAQEIFKDLVTNADSLIMHVTRPEMPLKQYCELSMLINGKQVNVKNKILDKVKLMKPAEYQKIHFKQGSVTDVIVSYVESPIRFFVQTELHQSMLDLLMKSVEKYCTTEENKEVLYVEDVNENMAVCALYSEDQKWYRGLIIDEPDVNGNVVVLFIDYGNQEETHYTKLRVMNNEMISEFPMLAIECRLDIDADLAVNEAVIDHFLDLVNGNSYRMKVLNVLPAHVLLVDLLDENEKSIKDILLQFAAPPAKDPFPASDYSRGVSNNPVSQGSWRNRNNSGGVVDNFAAFKREDSRDSQRFSRNTYADSNTRKPYRNDADEKDNVAAKTDDFWNDLKRNHYTRDERPSRKFDRNENNSNDDSRYRSRGEGSWNRDSDDNSRAYKSRDDHRRSENNWLSRDGNRDGESRRPYKPRDDNEAPSRKPYQKQDEDSTWNTESKENSWMNKERRSFNSREDGGFRKPQQKREDSQWNSKTYDSTPADLDNSESTSHRSFDAYQKPYQKRGGRDNQQNGDSWNSKADDGFKSKKYDSYSGRDHQQNNDSWNSKADDGFKSKKYDSHGDGRDHQQDGNSWNMETDDGFKSKKYDYHSGFDSRASNLEPGFEKGAKFVEYEYQPGQQLGAVISWFINPVQFYIIPAENEEFRQLMTTIQNVYPKRERVDIATLSIDDCIVARDSDNIIYRARVINGRPGGVLVNFVDYGNTALIKKDNVWTVSEEHCTIPVQATCCSLNNITTVNEDTPWAPATELEPFFNQDKYFVTFIANDDGEQNSKSWFVDLVNEDNKDIGELLVEAGFAAKKSVLQSDELYDIDLLRHQILTVFPGHVESSKKFFVHIEPPKVESIRQIIAQLVANPQGLNSMPPEKIVEGEFCLGRSSDDEYYRALILKTDPIAQSAHIWFIDYGDENDVSFDLIKILPEHLAIYSPQIMECCLFEGESFDDDEGFANAIGETDFIIKVMDVIDNKLHVLVYDIEGQRLPYPVAVEESIPALCPLPVLKYNDRMVISHITKEKVYLQRVIDETFIVDLADQLTELYESGDQEKVVIEEGQFYAAKSGQFGSWYRCRLDRHNSQEVFFIDYGNTESIEELLSIRPLDKKFFASPEFCIGVSCPIEFKVDDLTPLCDAVQETVFAVTFESIGSNEWFVNLQCETTGKSLGDFAADIGCGTKIDVKDTEVLNYNAFEGWKLDEEKAVNVCHINTPENFFMRKIDDSIKVMSMHENLQLSLKNVLPLIGKSGKLAAAQNPDDGKWYRARAVENGDMFAVDFGFTLKSPRLKQLPKVFILDTNNYIICCSLNIQPITENWTTNAISRFSEAVSTDQDVTAKLEFIKSGKKYFDLKIGGASLSSTLVNEKIAKWKSHEVVVSHVVSLKEFFVQDREREDELYNLVEKLQEASNWEIIDPAVNDLVACQFVDDELWYRAVITSVENDVKHVKFIDYGNESSCTEFRILPNELKVIPAFATQCTLHPLPNDAEELDELFVEFVNNVVKGTFTIYILSGVEPMPVMLEFNGESIENVLLQKKTSRENGPGSAEIGETVIVSHINSPSSFYVQSDTVPIDQVENSLVNIENTPLSTGFICGDFVAAKYPEDGLWYRAKVTEVNDGAVMVFFIDYGNTSAVTELRSLPDESKTIPCLAKHCAFEFPIEMQQWPDVATARFSELTCNGNTVFKMTIKEEGDPAIVDLQDNGTNVADELATLCKADLTAPVRETDLPVVCLSHVQSLNSIWIQMQTPQLDEMISEMANADTFDELISADEGALVAALFEEDGQWYRAQVLQKIETGYRVLFIDYGNESDVNLIRSLPEDLVNLSPLAKCCCLKDFPEESDELVNKLEEFVNDATPFFVNEEIEVDGKVIVSLKCSDDRNLTAELLKSNEIVSLQPQPETEKEECNESSVVMQENDVNDQEEFDDITSAVEEQLDNVSFSEYTQEKGDTVEVNVENDAIIEEEITKNQCSEEKEDDEENRAHEEALAEEGMIGFNKHCLAEVSEFTQPVIHHEAGDKTDTTEQIEQNILVDNKFERQSELNSLEEDMSNSPTTAADITSVLIGNDVSNEIAAHSAPECKTISVEVHEFESNVADDESDTYMTPSSMTTEDFVTPDRLDTSVESDALNTSFCEFSSSLDGFETFAKKSRNEPSIDNSCDAPSSFVVENIEDGNSIDFNNDEYQAPIQKEDNEASSSGKIIIEVVESSFEDEPSKTDEFQTTVIENVLDKTSSKSDDSNDNENCDDDISLEETSSPADTETCDIQITVTENTANAVLEIVECSEIPSSELAEELLDVENEVVSPVDVAEPDGCDEVENEDSVSSVSVETLSETESEIKNFESSSPQNVKDADLCVVNGKVKSSVFETIDSLEIHKENETVEPFTSEDASACDGIKNKSTKTVQHLESASSVLKNVNGADTCDENETIDFQFSSLTNIISSEKYSEENENFEFCSSAQVDEVDESQPEVHSVEATPSVSTTSHYTNWEDESEKIQDYHKTKAEIALDVSKHSENENVTSDILPKIEVSVENSRSSLLHSGIAFRTDCSKPDLIESLEDSCSSTVLLSQNSETCLKNECNPDNVIGNVSNENFMKGSDTKFLDPTENSWNSMVQNTQCRSPVNVVDVHKIDSKNVTNEIFSSEPVVNNMTRNTEFSSCKEMSSSDEYAGHENLDFPSPMKVESSVVVPPTVTSTTEFSNEIEVSCAENVPDAIIENFTDESTESKRLKSTLFTVAEQSLRVKKSDPIPTSFERCIEEKCSKAECLENGVPHAASLFDNTKKDKNKGESSEFGCENSFKNSNNESLDMADHDPLENHDFRVIRVNSPDSFYLRKVEDVVQIKKVESVLNEKASTGEICELTDPEVGQLVAAKINNLWVRARIEEFSVSLGIQLICIDYGNVCQVEKVYKLPEHLESIPPLALHCALSLPNDMMNWSENACQVFLDLVLTGNETMKIRILSEDVDVMFVDLLHNERSILEQLVKSCEVRKVQLE